MSTRTFQAPSTSSHPRPDRRRWSWIIGDVFALLFVLGLAVSCAQPGDDRSARPVPATEPAEPAAFAPAPDVTLPVVGGRNGKVVLDELRGLGLTAVRTASSDGAEPVLLPENWIVTRIEPVAGSVVRADEPVVVTMARPEPAPTRAPEPEVAPQRTHPPTETHETQVSVPERRSVPAEAQPREVPEAAQPRESVYYKNCDAARAAGAAPLHRGDPGYSSKLDRDDDGVGCEN